MAKRRIVLGCLPKEVDLLRKALEEKGYEVVVATNGKEIKATVERSPFPSAFIVDMKLPTWWKSGADAMMMIRRTYRVPVVYIDQTGESPISVSQIDEKGAIIRHGDVLSQSEIDEMLQTLAGFIEHNEHTISDYEWD